MKRLLAIIFLSVQTGCVTYQSKPIDPVRAESEFRARNLNDPGLTSLIRRQLPAASRTPSADTAETWNLDKLTLAAFYYHPDLLVARAQFATAAAGVETAGARPNPTIGISPGWEDVAPPFLFGATFDVPIETAGKRERRIDQAEALSNAARIHIEEVAWQLRSSVRSALLDYLLTKREAEDWRNQEQARTTSVALLEQRLAVGSLSRPELDAARIELTHSRLALRTAEGRVSETLAALAASVGVTPSALDDVTVQYPDLDTLPPLTAISAAAAQRAGLLGRSDVRRSLMEYSAAEAALHLEIAKQYPDIQISPGYSFDQGANKYNLGLSMSLPIFDQNQGPIAEARAKRAVAAAQFTAIQNKAISDTASALARYRSALEALDEADRAVALSRQNEQAMQQAFDAGQQDNLALAGAKVEVATAETSRLDTLRAAQAALGALEDAVQRPLEHGDAWIDPAAAALTDSSVKGHHP